MLFILNALKKKKNVPTKISNIFKFNRRSRFNCFFNSRIEEKKFCEERDTVFSSGSGQEWAHIGTLIDLKAVKMEGKDTSRMKKILIEMKQSK